VVEKSLLEFMALSKMLKGKWIVLKGVLALREM
jgi:hypothetical protein